jgi:large-conductance mechanosensitive channel
MTLLIRFVLISIIIYLIIRSFARYFQELTSSGQKDKGNTKDDPKSKGVSKDVGEYVDYEEVD